MKTPSAPFRHPIPLLFCVFLAVAFTVPAALGIAGIAEPRTLADPGALVRVGLPAVLAVHHLAMATTLGTLMLAAVILPQDPPGAGSGARQRERAVGIVAVAAAVWALAAAAIIVLSYSDLIGQPVSTSAEFGRQLGSYVTEQDLGRTWLAVTAIAVCTSTLAFALRSAIGITTTLVLACTAVIPLSLIGHAAASDDHNGAVNALALHLLGVCLWMGGVIGLALITRQLSTDTKLVHTVISRFSALAGVAFCMVVISGIINAAYRIANLDGLATPYGSLVLFKTAATLALGYIGWKHRHWIQGRGGSTGNSTRLWRLIGVESVLMGAVMGVSAVLGKTPPAPRVSEPDVTPAKVMTGYVLPPELQLGSWLTQWRWDWLWVAAALLLACAYLIGIRRLRAAGGRWPVRRTVLWLGGLSLLVYVTSGALAVYLPVLFGMHTATYLLLVFAVPLLLTGARPYALASATIPKRTDGSFGWREAMGLWPGSSPGRLLSRPAVAGAFTAVALVVFYDSPLFRWSLADHVGHELMITASLAIGMVLAAAVLGKRPREEVRAGICTLFGLSALMGLGAAYIGFLGHPLQVEWFASLGRTDTAGVLADYRSGAASLVLAGVVPLLVAGLAVGVRLDKAGGAHSGSPAQGKGHRGAADPTMPA